MHILLFMADWKIHEATFIGHLVMEGMVREIKLKLLTLPFFSLVEFNLNTKKEGEESPLHHSFEFNVHYGN